jgi:arginine decarboxylase
LTTQEIIEAQRKDWTVEDAVSLYMIDRWGAGTSTWRERRHDRLAAAGRGHRGADHRRRARGAGAQPRAPLLIRFQDLLRHRVEMLNSSFNARHRREQVRGSYRGVFPIKVNQLREVVEEILDAGVRSTTASKSARSRRSSPASPCTAIPSRSSSATATRTRVHPHGADRPQARQEGHPHRREDLRGARDHEDRGGDGRRAVDRHARAPAVERRRQVGDVGGEHAKFGLSTAEILEAIEIMREAKMESAFKLLHFHIGSQIPDILTIKRAVREAAMYYAKLYKSGHRSSTSTSAAAWPSTTTARARRSTRR